MNFSSLTPDKQVKLQYWMDVIRQCRASGLTNQTWCEQHDISLKSYYYWLAKIRKLALEDLPRKKNGIHTLKEQQPALLADSPSDFAELFFVKHFSLKKALKFPVFIKGFSLLSAGIDQASLRMRACSIR